MSDDLFEDFLASADAEFDKAPAKSSKNERRFPCGQCGGTGRYQGHRVHQEKSHCFACRGKGYFKTDPRKLAANRAKARQSKADALANGLRAFEAEQPAMYRELADVRAGLGSSNEFIVSLAEQIFTKGRLSEKQVAAWHRGKEKLEAIRAAKHAEREANAVAVDLSPIEQMFATAFASGYKKPSYRANGLRLKPGKNGAFYVLTEERMEPGYYGMQPGYEGKIVDGKFFGIRATAAAAGISLHRQAGRSAQKRLA